MRAQSSVEYIIVLGVALTILLIVLSISGFFAGFSADTRIGESQSYWSNAASPFAIVDAKFHGTYLDVVVHNRASSRLTLSEFFLSRADAAYSPIGLSQNFQSGGKVGFRFTLPTPCSPGTAYEFDASFNYSTESVSSLMQQGAKPFIVRCTE